MRKSACILKQLGFVANPHDPCVFNKDSNGKQCTLVLRSTETLWEYRGHELPEEDPTNMGADLTRIVNLYHDGVRMSAVNLQIDCAQLITNKPPNPLNG
jgi:hypothetical protein